MRLSAWSRTGSRSGPSSAAGTAELDGLLEGPTALTFIKGDAVTAAKAISTFGRQHGILEYKGGLMDGAVLAPDQFTVIARLPGLDVLRGQLVGVAASPLTGLTRGLASLLSGLAVALGQIQEKGLVSGEAEAPAEPAAEASSADAEEPADEGGSPTSEETETDDSAGESEGEAQGSEESENDDGSEQTGSGEAEAKGEATEEDE